MNKFIILISLFVFSCSAVKSNKDKVVKDSFTDSDALLTIERTACFGECPYYKLVIFDTKKMIYLAGENVIKLDNENIILSDADFKEIFNKFNSLPFSTYENSYADFIRDLPYIFVSFKDKKVRMMRSGDPKELMDFVHYLEKKFEIVKD